MSKKSAPIPYRKIIIILLFLSIGMQFIVISQMYFYKTEIFNDPSLLANRIGRGVLLTFFAGVFLTFPTIFIIKFLNRRLPWKKNPIFRFSIQFVVAIVLGLGVTPLILIPASLMFHLEFSFEIILNNSYYLVILSFFLQIIYEAWFYFDDGIEAKKKTEILEKELSQIRFEVLKNQINPHFMFNSLNVLSGLINQDTVKAQQFIDEFSHIYRYVLETIDQPVTTLKKELEFVNSYLFLQQIRYGDHLKYNIHIPNQFIERLLPPLSMQIVLENAIKHNIINQEHPLQINIYVENEQLVVVNKMQAKISKEKSTGVGINNLTKRYSFIYDVLPTFTIKNQEYIVKLPLIEAE